MHIIPSIALICNQWYEIVYMYIFYTGGFGISGKGGSDVCIKGFALLILYHFLIIPRKWNNLVSVRPNYFIFMGYFFKKGVVGSSEPLNPLWIRHCIMKITKERIIASLWQSQRACVVPVEDSDQPLHPLFDFRSKITVYMKPGRTQPSTWSWSDHAGSASSSLDTRLILFVLSRGG